MPKSPYPTGARPVIFLAFAQDRQNGTRYLRNLPEESRQIQAALKSARWSGLCDIVPLANATRQEIFDIFQEYRDRIAIFHYGGHAGSFQILAESPGGSPQPVHAAGLAAFLAQQRGLQLVFLNGCSTEKQAQGLLEAGIPAVIVTSQDIDDAVAADFAARFHKGLASGACIGTAFSEAVADIQSAKGNNPRHLYKEKAAEKEGWPWVLYPEEGGAAWRWKLPTIDELTKPVPIPQLLPYLSDRSGQEAELRRALNDLQKEKPARPLVCFIHGNEDECHDMYLMRLHQITLPKLLGLNDEDGGVEKKVAEWPTSIRARQFIGDRVRGCLAKALLGNSEASPQEMQTAIKSTKKPIMIQTDMFTDNWEAFGPELMSAFLKFWNDFPDYSREQVLIFCISIGYQQSVGKGFWRRRSYKRLNKAIRHFLTQLDFNSFDKVQGIVLPELLSISQAEVFTWVHEHAQQFCQIDELFREIRALYEQGIKERLSMEYLAEELRTLLKEYQS
ncbi:CHAT domain-containing protein [candidate division KSB1 bacterium]|nr:CHAT domain-containing protein [candidate division KSB1 bacterium]